ncbi:hypothetical protein DNTS_006563 [Danionella cerebrum]|uniref:Uncharacterized protein n=1 Tax=Danionella cerebrum TaxID=2873325 RepID=A0A553NAC7_9TELE|nr:hypothetical protein DNTS_006563 [Danionella translucida]
MNPAWRVCDVSLLLPKTLEVLLPFNKNNRAPRVKSPHTPDLNRDPMTPHLQNSVTRVEPCLQETAFLRGPDPDID